MEIGHVLFFDTETTGLPEKGASWETDYEGYPHIVQIAWVRGGIEKSHIIRPEGWEIPEDMSAIHGITTERALADGEPFAIVIDEFLSDCHDAGLLCGHNIHFDTGMVKANILRELGKEYFDAVDVEGALYKGKRIDTMRAAMKWVDARTMNGRLKFPNLAELYSRCFPGETFPAHDALEDTRAVARCLPVLVELGLVELKVKEYPEELPNNPVSAFVGIVVAASRAATIAADAAKKFGKMLERSENGSNSGLCEKDDKSLNFSDKASQNENSEKINNEVARLLQQNDF